MIVTKKLLLSCIHFLNIMNTWIISFNLSKTFRKLYPATWWSSSPRYNRWKIFCDVCKQFINQKMSRNTSGIVFCHLLALLPQVEACDWHIGRVRQSCWWSWLLLNNEELRCLWQIIIRRRRTHWSSRSCYMWCLSFTAAWDLSY
jgi:hypothetical protein